MEDKRIIKTKKAIYQALKELYLENDFEDISITQLTEKANIGRKTFYLHYSSIDDIVDEIVKKLYDNLKKKYNELYNFVDFNNLFSFLNTYIRTMYFEYKDVISVIIQKDKKLLIIKKITSIMKQEIERTIKQSYDIEDKLIPYYSDIIPSVLINNFSLYLKDGSSLSWEEVEGVIYDCLLNGLSSLKVK